MAKQAFSSYFSVFSAFFSCFCLLNERNSLYLPAEKENFINNIHFFKREIMNKTELIDKIAAKKVAKFKAGAELADAVNK